MTKSSQKLTPTQLAVPLRHSLEAAKVFPTVDLAQFCPADRPSSARDAQPRFLAPIPELSPAALIVAPDKINFHDFLVA